MGNDCYMEQDGNNDRLWICDNKIWSNLKSEFGLNDQDIKDLIKNMVEEHFKMKVSTPNIDRTNIEHFKMKVSTPH